MRITFVIYISMPVVARFAATQGKQITDLLTSVP
jgi:hypothetical protein